MKGGHAQEALTFAGAAGHAGCDALHTKVAPAVTGSPQANTRYRIGRFCFSVSSVCMLAEAVAAACRGACKECSVWQSNMCLPWLGRILVFTRACCIGFCYVGHSLFVGCLQSAAAACHAHGFSSNLAL